MQSSLSLSSLSSSQQQQCSSVKLIQQQVKGFIQALSGQELSKLLDIFEKSISSSSTNQLSRSCKMVQYKCYESKLELDGKIGCGFGRSQEDALAISVKDFFEVILQDDKYLIIVKECFKLMKSSAYPAPAAVVGNNNNNNNSNSSPIQKTKKEQQQQQQEEQSDEDEDELSIKIGNNISVINGANIKQNQNNTTQSQSDIDDTLFNIVFHPENGMNNHNSNNILSSENVPSFIISNRDTLSQQSQLQQQSQQPLTQFQIYSLQQQLMKQQQQQQQQQEQQLQQQSQINMQTPPKKHSLHSQKNNNNSYNKRVPQQLNDTAFMPITKKPSVSNHSQSKQIRIDQINNPQIVIANQFQQKKQGISNKENNHSSSSLTKVATNPYSSSNGNQSQIHQCQYREELEREKHRNQSLEKRMQLLVEENKILKQVLLKKDNNDGSPFSSSKLMKDNTRSSSHQPNAKGNLGNNSNCNNINSNSNTNNNNNNNNNNNSKQNQQQKLYNIECNEFMSMNEFNNSSYFNNQSVRKATSVAVPKLNLQVLPNFHRNQYSSNGISHQIIHNNNNNN